MSLSASRTRKFSVYASFLLSLSLLLLITGCTDYKQLKTDLLQAVAKQEQVTSYQFKGSIELKADPSLLGATSPFTATLFAFLKDSKIDYNGLTAMDPAQLEANFKVTPSGGTVMDIPVLIKENKLFFRIPALNKDDEYLVFPITGKTSPAAGSTEALKNTNHLTSTIYDQLLNGINAEWLQTSKDPVTLADGTITKRITLDINNKNEQAFNSIWKQAIPGFTELLKSNGLASTASIDGWQTALKEVQFRAPSSLEFLIDNQGFIHEQKWSLTFSANGSTNENHLLWTQSLSELNKAPVFTKEIPTKQKSLEDLLKLVKPAPAAKKP
ncbi:hypothetical protein SAMN03159341_10571 [Paenibacillus sp. 1_12]|uniref:hypothetical protein n=1 Tax=Paenibacillus sp. 1_12 TaxID=1566278 RepID=UPI0008E23C1C|nr:hypothetical protein [Paenibacillus sp. 1_12]SFL32096.1 hypothetical protein SAMN03159341_10571 [Paenibacillus sp. 1_12]